MTKEYTFEKDAMLMVSDAHGIYIPQMFAQLIDGSRFLINGIATDDEDLQLLRKADPHTTEDYWETWEHVIDDLRFYSPETDTSYFIWHDGDCWLVPEGCAIPE